MMNICFTCTPNTVTPMTTIYKMLYALRELLYGLYRILGTSHALRNERTCSNQVNQMYGKPLCSPSTILRIAYTTKYAAVTGPR